MKASETITLDVKPCIGRFYVLYAKELGRQVLANCIDATPEGVPKRMRVQKCSKNGGDVLMPHQYTIMEVDPQWED